MPVEISVGPPVLTINQGNTTTNTISGALTMAPGQQLALTGSAGIVTLTQNLALSAGSYVFSSNTAAFIFNGVISGSGGIVKLGPGNLVLGIRDRNGDQTGRFLESDPAHDPFTQEGISAGATLRAVPNATQTTWTLENNGSAGGVTTGGANIGFGPGGGMFYFQDNYSNSATARNQNGSGHNDVTAGGVLQGAQVEVTGGLLTAELGDGRVLADQFLKQLAGLPCGVG